MNVIEKEVRVKIKEYCILKQLEYKIILAKINYKLTNKNILNSKTIEELLEEATKKYLSQRHINNISHNLKLLNVAKTNKEYRTICSNLKINWNHILKLSYQGYDKKQTILYFWYFSDQLKDGKKDLSRKRIYEIKEEKQLSSQGIYYLIAYYKCGKRDYLEKILIFEEKYIKRITNSISHKFNLSLTQKEDLISEAKLILIQIIDKITLNEIGQMINYIRLVLFGRLFDYAKNNYQKITEFNETYMYKEELYDAIQFSF